MRKIFLIVLIVLVFTKNTIAQSSQEVTALLHDLKAAVSDTTRASLLSKLAILYLDLNPDSALFYSDEAFALAHKISLHNIEVRSTISKGNVVWIKGDITGAMKLYMEALSAAEKKGFIFEQTFALTRIGAIYQNSLRDYEASLSFFMRAQKIKPPLTEDSRFMLAALDLNYGRSLLELAKYDSARVALTRAEVISRGLGIRPVCLMFLGTLEFEEGNEDLAIEYQHRSLREFRINQTSRGVAEACNQLATFYDQMARPDSALYYSTQALDKAQQIGFKLEAMKAARRLARLFSPEEPMTALKFSELASVLEEELNGPGKVIEFNKLLLKNQQEIFESKAEITAYRNRVRLYSLIGSLAVVVALAAVFYSSNRSKQKANTLLNKQKEELQLTLGKLKATQSQLVQSEKMASLGELTAGIAHEIQNPLNFVNNFSEVNTELLSELEKAANEGNLDDVKSIAKNMKENEEKINHHGKRADGIVKSMLQHSRKSTGQKELTDINALCDEYLRLAYHGYRAKDKSFNAKVESDFDAALPRITVVPQDMGRVILNLINNAFYAVNEKLKAESQKSEVNYEPTVIVSTKMIQNKIVIIVKDNGTGIPQKALDKIFQPFFTTKPTGQGTGLGLSLSYDIVKAHGGEMTIETREGEGSGFIVSLKKS